MTDQIKKVDLPSFPEAIRTGRACEWLDGIFEAYLAALTGNVRVEVRVADRLTRYSRSDADKLLELLHSLAPACPTFPRHLLPGRAGGFSPAAARGGRFGGLC